MIKQSDYRSYARDIVCHFCGKHIPIRSCADAAALILPEWACWATGHLNDFDELGLDAICAACAEQRVGPIVQPIPVRRTDSLWLTLGWPLDPVRVGFSIRTIGGKIQLYYNAEFPPFLEMQRRMSRKSLEEEFDRRYRISWCCTPSSR